MPSGDHAIYMMLGIEPGQVACMGIPLPAILSLQ